MYPPLPYLDRICTNEEGYSLDPYDNFIIPKGMPIVIPIFSIHRDPMVISFDIFLIQIILINSLLLVLAKSKYF